MRLNRTHRKRLMDVWRSAGWPYKDATEIELIAAGLLAHRQTADGRESIELTPAAITLLAEDKERGRVYHSAHDKLAQTFAQRLLTSGRIVWRELSLRAIVGAAAGARSIRSSVPSLWQEADAPQPSEPVNTSAHAAWRLCRPDLFSVRRTSVESYLQPQVHEVKASRADLLSDLRNPAKREAYAWLCSQYYYVFPEGVAEPDEIPRPAGVIVARQQNGQTDFTLARAAAAAPCKLPFEVWMAMAVARPLADEGDDRQQQLGGGTPDI